MRAGRQLAPATAARLAQVMPTLALRGRGRHDHTAGSLARSSSSEAAVMIDPLADVLRTMRLTGGVFLDAEFSAPWCILAEVGPEDCQPFMPMPAQVIAYHYVASGRLLLQVGREPPIEAERGELLVLPRNDPHILCSGPGLQPVDASG